VCTAQPALSAPPALNSSHPAAAPVASAAGAASASENSGAAAGAAGAGGAPAIVTTDPNHVPDELKTVTLSDDFDKEIEAYQKRGHSREVTGLQMPGPISKGGKPAPPKPAGGGSNELVKGPIGKVRSHGVDCARHTLRLPMSDPID
jgi:hypothetical protein